jgi:SAM-dependent methyltransferase
MQGSYDARYVNSTLENEIRRLDNQVLLSWDKEVQILSYFGLQDGMSVIDLGCGPGFYTKHLLDLLPHSSVSALELDPILFERAREFLQPTTNQRPYLIKAPIIDTGLEDNTFDFAIARLIFAHLPSPVVAAREVRRILKPGGKLVIIDCDYDMFWLFNPPIPEIQILMDKDLQRITLKGGDALIGRKLNCILQSAGFHNIELDTVIVNSDEKGVEPFLPQIDPARLTPLVKAGYVTEQEFNNFFDSRKNFLSSPNPFILMQWFMSCGTKITN